MLNRRTVWKTFKNEGVLDMQDAKVQALITYVREHPQRCWSDLIPIYREQFYDTYESILPVLVKMQDPVVNSVLIRNLDPTKNNELKTLEAIADTTNSRKDPLSFKRLAKIGNSRLNKKLATKELPEKIKSLLTVRVEESTNINVASGKTDKSKAKKAPSKKR